MHFLISRSRTVLQPPLAGAALVRGPVGTAAAAVDVRQEVSAERDVMVKRLDALDRADHDAVFHPLLDALSAVAERGGRLDAAEAAGYARALETANASLERRLKERASATTSATTATTATSAAPGATAAPAASGATGVTDRAGIAVADPVSDLLTQLQSTVDGLVKALTGALGTVTGLLSPVVGVVTGLLGGGLSGLPALPAAGSPAPSSR
ncbi:hypothetical protein ACH40F_22145 [Streptomyces sp. NPDC020794]|uniref:hypothetical protein n=1 Tax=unclassified Streptomyces TaxID=2593676 RepID=UPI0036E18A32